MATYRRARSTRLLVVGLVLASLMTITLDFRAGERGPLAAIGRASLTVVTPLQETVAAVFRPIGSFFSTLASLGSLKSENERLREEAARLRSAEALSLEYRRKIEELTRLLDLKEELELVTRGATVIGESVSNFEWAIFVDRGSDDGVALDMPVIAADGLVGRVVKVTRSSSKVMLIFDPDSKVAVRLASTGERGLVVGRRASDLRLDLINRETDVQPGELVVTSGYEGALFPPGVPVGVVSKVIPSDVDLTKRVLVRPNVDFSRLEYVLLVLPHADVGELGR